MRTLQGHAVRGGGTVRWRKEYADWPVIKCLPWGDQLRFWCPFCREWHTHGKAEGHRIDHCYHGDHEFYKAIPSPFHEKHGYFIIEMTKAELEETKDRIEQELRRREAPQ